MKVRKNMANQYEIREDASNKNWPFQVWNLTTDRKVDFFSTREEAQKRIDGMAIDYGFITSIYGNDPANEKPLPVETTTESVQPELPEEIIIGGQNTVGSLVEYKGQRWLVTLSESEDGVTSADARDDMDEQLPPGWHSWLVKVQPGNTALEVVAELVKSGEARLLGSADVLFTGEKYSSSLRDLAYSDELGVYDRSKIKV